jgi:hypothetical protein
MSTRAIEKVSPRRLAAAQTRQPVRGKGKPARPSTPPPKPAAKVVTAAAKVIKVVPKVGTKVVPAASKKERASVRPPAPSAVQPLARVEQVRLHGSEHGAAISRTDHLKARFAALSNAVSQIKAQKRAISKNFFEIGGLLERIRAEKLYEVKGYGSFESFVEREVDIDKLTCTRLARVSRVLVREAALEVGLDRACAAVAALDADVAAPAAPAQSYPVSSSVSSALPAHKR